MDAGDSLHRARSLTVRTSLRSPMQSIRSGLFLATVLPAFLVAACSAAPDGESTGSASEAISFGGGGINVGPLPKSPDAPAPAPTSTGGSVGSLPKSSDVPPQIVCGPTDHPIDNGCALQALQDTSVNSLYTQLL